MRFWVNFRRSVTALIVLVENAIVITAAVLINYVFKADLEANPTTAPYANYITIGLNGLQSAILGFFCKASFAFLTDFEMQRYLSPFFPFRSLCVR